MLDNDQKRLLFDYCLHLASPQQAAQAARLIESDDEAARTFRKLQSAFSPLKAVETDACPDHLVQATLGRLNQVAHLAQLQQLLQAEQAATKPFNKRTWRTLARCTGVAAVIGIAFAIWMAPLGFARQKYFQKRCQMQMANIFRGFTNYRSDHNGATPTIVAATGSPWWKVGYQGAENHSNTRNLWLLVKSGYVNPADFICPGRKSNRFFQRKIRIDKAQLKLNDFPDRHYVTYSSRIRCPKTTTNCLMGQTVIMADSNPLFEKMPNDYSKSLRLQLSRDMLVRNSLNHGRRGQNILRGDGSVKFLKRRFAGISTDDIYTLQEMSPGSEVRGCETPSCESDAFLAP